MSTVLMIAAVLCVLYIVGDAIDRADRWMQRRGFGRKPRVVITVEWRSRR